MGGGELTLEGAEKRLAVGERQINAKGAREGESERWEGDYSKECKRKCICRSPQDRGRAFL